MPAGLRSGSTVGHDHHLLPTALLVLVPLVAVSLGQSRVVIAVSTTKVALYSLLASSILGGVT
jgi:hypothetical protein